MLVPRSRGLERSRSGAKPGPRPGLRLGRPPGTGRKRSDGASGEIEMIQVVESSKGKVNLSAATSPQKVKAALSVSE